MQILLVEDGQSLASGLPQTLVSEGYPVGTGKEADSARYPSRVPEIIIWSQLKLKSYLMKRGRLSFLKNPRSRRPRQCINPCYN